MAGERSLAFGFAVIRERCGHREIFIGALHHHAQRHFHTNVAVGALIYYTISSLAVCCRG